MVYDPLQRGAARGYEAFTHPMIKDYVTYAQNVFKGQMPIFQTPEYKYLQGFMTEEAKRGIAEADRLLRAKGITGGAYSQYMNRLWENVLQKGLKVAPEVWQNIVGTGRQLAGQGQTEANKMLAQMAAIQAQKHGQAQQHQIDWFRNWMGTDAAQKFANFFGGALMGGMGGGGGSPGMGMPQTGTSSWGFPTYGPSPQLSSTSGVGALGI